MSEAARMDADDAWESARTSAHAPTEVEVGRAQLHPDRLETAGSEHLDPLRALREHQAERCAVCDEKRKRLFVDHDHETGWVRGLLCNGCNSSEGRGFRAPWFAEYRENPPAAQIGLRVQYGQHLPRPPRVAPDRASRTERRHAIAPKPEMDIGPWLDMMIAEAETGAEAGPEPTFEGSSGNEAPQQYRMLCERVGYAPLPKDVSPAEWRMALAEAYETETFRGRDPLWFARAVRAFIQLARSRESSDSYLLGWADR